MKQPSTWNEAVRSVIERFGEFTAPIASSPDTIDSIVNKMRPWLDVKEWADHYAPTILIHAIGREACGHLKSIGEWNTEQMIELLVSKQTDYGHDNINRFGVVGLIVRISDKVARLTNLHRRNTSPKNESVLDTWRDLFGYAVIGEMLADHTFNLDLETTNG